jgi:integrase
MDRQFLLRQRQGWYACVEVPPSLRLTLGRRRLKRTLQTRDIAVARARRWRVVADLKAKIEQARQAQQGDPLVAEAMTWKDALAVAATKAVADEDFYFSPEEDAISDAVAARVEELDLQGNPRWRTFRDIVAGKATPVDYWAEAWLTEGGVRGKPISPRTVAIRRLYVRDFAGWLAGQPEGATVEAVTRKVAGRYAASLGPRSQSVAVARVGALRSYWAWLDQRGHLPEDTRNPWVGVSPRGQASSGVKARAFTGPEVALLVTHAPSRVMREFILSAALTGLRREELGRLRVRDITGGVFNVRGTKTEAAQRRVPIHSTLAPIVERLIANRSPDAWLFDLPGMVRNGGERTEAIGKAFLRYRRECGLQEGEGRRSNLTFHSLRHFWVTEALNAGQPRHLVSWLAGHAEGKKGMTLGVYWSGPTDEQTRPVVEAVRIPGVTD